MKLDLQYSIKYLIEIGTKSISGEIYRYKNQQKNLSPNGLMKLSMILEHGFSQIDASRRHQKPKEFY